MVVVMITDYVKRCFILLKYDTMGEEQGDLTVERIAKIRRAVKKASELGIKDRGQRREAVIDAQSAKEEGILDISQEEARAFPSVAKADIRTESRQVQERAINKYLEVEEGDRNVPVLVDAVHDAPPAPSTIRHILRQDGLEASLDEIKDSLGRIVGNGEPKSELDQKVKAVWTASFDMNTGLIARQVARVLKASVIVAKKPRTHADPNRTWRFRKTAPIEGVNKYLAREYPRSVLAAFYWAARRILQSQNLLDDSGRLKKQFLRVAIHGMVDRGGYDLAVGGSLKIADSEVVEKFAEPRATTCEGGDAHISLRVCLTCGHVGCCDDSPGKHVRRHAKETGHLFGAMSTITTLSLTRSAIWLRKLVEIRAGIFFRGRHPVFVAL